MKLLKEIEYVKRVWERKDGILKIEVWSYGRSGRTLLGSNANGHWKVRGYKIPCGRLYPTLRELREPVLPPEKPTIFVDVQ